MNILFLLTQDLNSPSGLGRYWPIARQLVRLGHQVNIAALHPNISELENTFIEKEGVKIHYVASMHVLKRENIKTYYPSSQLLPIVLFATMKLMQSALSLPADIIHIGKPHPMNSIAGLVTKYLHGKHVYLDCDDYEAGSGRFTVKLQKIIVTYFEKLVPKHVEAITTNTSFMRQRLQEWGIPTHRIHYLPNGVDLDRFSPHSVNYNQVEYLRKKLDLVGKQVAAYIGSMSLQSHPIDLLIEAFSQVLKFQPNTVLLLVGGGEDYHKLILQVQRMGISTSVRFCGRVPPEKVTLYYRLADVSIDPVNDDDAARGRAPLKLLESWASEVPFVTANVGDRPMMIGSPPAGVLAQAGDPWSLSDCILQVLQNVDKANEMRHLGLERVQLFTWDRLTRLLEALYTNAKLDEKFSILPS